MVGGERPESVITEMLLAVRDFFTVLGIFTVMLVTLGYAWGYFA